MLRITQFQPCPSLPQVPSVPKPSCCSLSPFLLVLSLVVREGIWLPVLFAAALCVLVAAEREGSRWFVHVHVVGRAGIGGLR